jgi:hypothetical protein
VGSGSGWLEEECPPVESLSPDGLALVLDQRWNVSACTVCDTLHATLPATDSDSDMRAAGV